jgi:hypothetical protein
MFKKIVVPIFLAAIMAIGIFSSSAMAQTALPTGSSTSVTVTTTTEGGSKSASAPVFIRFYVLSYVKAKGLSKKEVANAEECRMIGEGTDIPAYTNSGILISTGSFGTFEDTDREKACKINGQWYLVRCGNHVWFYIKPNIIHGHVLLVRSFAHKRIRIHIPLHVKIGGNCGAEATSKIDQWVKYGALVKAKGNVKIRISGKIIDRIKAHVHVKTHCEKIEKVEKIETTTEKPSCSTCHEEEHPSCECTPPPCGEVEFFSEYEFEEAHVNEGPIQYWKYINAPKGHQLTVYFETEHGSFSPEVVQVASFGAETTKFQSYWTAPSHPGHYPVWVRVVDHTCGKTYESAKQFVTVLEWELSEPPR